jgi:hypothetical protein
MKISNNFGSPRRNPPQAAWIDGGSEPEIAGSTPREDPTDRTPRKKARSGEAAVDRTKAVAAIKGGREAETLKEEADDAGVNDDEVASGGCRRPTMATTVADAANVDDDEATNGTAGGTPREDPAAGIPRKKARSGEAAVDRTKASRPSRVDVRPRPSRRRPTTPALTTTRSQAAGAAVPPRPRPSPTRPTSMTTRPRTGPRAVLRGRMLMNMPN